MTRLSRRRLLTTAAVALSTGCLGRLSGDSTAVQQTSSSEPTATETTSADRPTSETASPTPTHESTARTTPPSGSATETPPTPSGGSPTRTIERCGELYEASVPVTVTTSEIFELSTTTEVVPYGGQLTVTLENTTETDQLSGTKSRCDIQKREKGSWDSVLYTDEYPVWRDIPVRHAPGEGFEWNVDIGPGIDFADRIDPSFQECERIEPGTYRFVYWGITRQPQGTNYALAVQFRLGER